MIRLIKCLVKEKAFGKQPLIVIDGGASGGFSQHWNRYGDQIILCGFDPNEREVVKGNRRLYKAALGRRKEKRTFYRMLHGHSSSFYPPNPVMVKRYAWDTTMKVVKEQEIGTIDIDSFVAENRLGYVDFIKLDVEGAELDILQGASNTLKGVIGIRAEVAFQAIRLGQPLYNQVDAFLQKRGFELYYIKGTRHFRYTLSVNPFPENRGQMAEGETMHFKPIVQEMDKRPKDWNRIRALKAISLLDLMGYPDAAIEVAQHAQKHKILSTKDATKYIDLITLLVDRKEVSYQEYWRLLREAVDTTKGGRDLAHLYKRHWHPRI